MSVQIQRRLFTVDEYYRMGELGFFHEDDRLELIRGEVVQMSPIGSCHAACVSRLTHLFVQNLESRAVVSVQNPVRLGDYTEPQPDLMVLRPRDDFYSDAHPAPEDVMLLVEAADSSIDYDRQVKMNLYAQAGIIEVWLIDLERRRIEIYSRPSSTGYLTVAQMQPGQMISPQLFPDVGLEVGELTG